MIFDCISTSNDSFGRYDNGSICYVKHQELVVVGLFEVLEGAADLYPRMPAAHPEELRGESFDLVAEDDRHATVGMIVPGFHEDWDNPVVLITCHLLGFLLFDQPEVEVLLARFHLRICILEQLHLLVEFLSVDLGDVLDHDRNILGVKLSLGHQGST